MKGAHLSANIPLFQIYLPHTPILSFPMLLPLPSASALCLCPLPLTSPSFHSIPGSASRFDSRSLILLVFFCSFIYRQHSSPYPLFFLLLTPVRVNLLPPQLYTLIYTLISQWLPFPASSPTLSPSSPVRSLAQSLAPIAHSLATAPTPPYGVPITRALPRSRTSPS